MQILLLLLLAVSVYSHNKVLLKDLKSVTLYKGEWTTGRRNSPIPQLNCTGGASSYESHKINTVQCTNTGFNGRDYNWKCEASMPNTIKFGKTIVSCEGYNYPNDPYVLVGSCGLKYTLEYTDKPNRVPHTTIHQTTTRTHRHQPSDDALAELFITVITFVVLVYLCQALFSLCRRPRTVVVGPMDAYVRTCPAHTVHVTQPVHVTSPTSPFVEGVILGTSLSRPTYVTPTHTTHITCGGSDSNSGDDHISTGYGETERR